MSLKGKYVVVTGGTKGLGLAIVRRLAAEGADLVVHYNSGDIAPVQQICREAGVQCLPMQADFTDMAQVAEMAHKITATVPVYALVNNAGICHFTDFFSLTLEDWDREFDVNIRAMFVLTQIIARQMADSGRGGRIVNFSSMAAKQGAPAQVHYGAAKGAVMSFTRALATALGEYGITVNCILPGPVPTQHNSSRLLPRKEAVEQKLPMRRLGQPENIADAVAYLLGEHADWTTGAMLSVDGGVTC